MRNRTGLALLLTLAVLIGACGGGGGTQGEAGGGAPGGDRQSITLGMASSDTFTAEWYGWMVGQELGYYDELGLDVEFVPTGGSGEAIEQLAAGNLDAGNPSMPSVGEALLSGIPLVNIYTYSNGAIFGVFVPQDSGIASIADLRGRRIGISEPGGGEVAFLEASLRAEGIDPISDVTLIPIGQGGPETFQAIESGQVDAYSSAYNDVFAMQVQGLSLNDLTPEQFKEFPARGIITRPEVVDEKAEALRRLARGTAMGTHFCYSNLEACEQIMRKVIPEVWEENAQGQSQGLLRFELAQEQVRPRDPNSYGAHNPEANQAFIDTIASTIENPEDVDVEAFLNEDFIAYANDFDRARVEEDAASYQG